MSNIDKRALRGQIVEGSFYLAECGHCGEMYPSNKLDGGEPLYSGDYGECFCHLCGADDTDIADCGAWGSEAVTAWNYQQKRIEALLDELEASQSENERLAKTLIERNGEPVEGLVKRVAELEEIATDYGMKFQRAQDVLKHQSLLHKSQMEAAESRIAELEAREVKPVAWMRNANVTSFMSRFTTDENYA